MAGWAHAAGGWVLGALAERWAGGSRDAVAEVTCRCAFEGPGITDGLVAILREQLARCGPEHLQGTPCQPCPSCPVPFGHYTGYDLLGSAAVGVAAGVGLATCFRQAHDLGAPRVACSPRPRVGGRRSRARRVGRDAVEFGHSSPASWGSS
eukprot:6055290-Pyramimonas_sp.AAC.1